MADQNIIYIESKSEAEKSKIECDAEFDPPTLNTRPDWYHLQLGPELQKLYRAAMDGKWEIAKAIIDEDQNTKTKEISPFGFTALHVAASCGRSEFVVELVKQLTGDELEIRDQLGRTALHHVALAASVEAAKAMVKKNPNLPYLVDKDHQTPLLYAAQWRHQLQGKGMLEYLFEVTKDEPPCQAFTGDSASNLIVAITALGAYDIALRILGKHPEFAYSKNDKGTSILHVLAMLPSAFPSGNKLYQWMRLMDAVELVKFVCGELQKKNNAFIQEYFFPKDGTAILHLAIEHGVLKLVQTCLEYFPDLIWYPNKKKRLLLHVAIEHRRMDIFDYMKKFIGDNTKVYAEFKEDEDHNNSLHLAAKLAPSSRLPSVLGPVFQMQREVQWFEAVRALVYYETMTGKNRNGQTPLELFIQQHADMLKDAKDWMKDMSNSCMVVAALVATVAFAAMITVPGGNHSETGIPILSRKKHFIAFTISNALSMISSAISLLMFLSLQTSRYAEEDFLDRIPKILRRGLIFLFLAVATMMISFAMGFGLSLQKEIFNWAYIPVTVVACCPAIIFWNLQVPLLLQTLRFTAGPGDSQGKRDWKFLCLNKFGYGRLADDEP